jgi:homoprotocatechuate degradation regulator HpaR
MGVSLKDGFELAETQRTLPIALLRAREAVMERFRPMLSAHDVSEQQWRVMRVLQEAGELDASRLAERACVLPPSLTRMLKSLEARGFIALRRDPQDGRRMQVSLTEAGDDFIAQVAPESVAIYREIEKLIGADEISDLLDRLEALLSALKTS